MKWGNRLAVKQFTCLCRRCNEGAPTGAQAPAAAPERTRRRHEATVSVASRIPSEPGARDSGGYRWAVAPRAVIFDFWGTLVPLDWGYWHRAYEKIAGVLGVPVERFDKAWRGDYECRLVSDLRSSIERVCAALGVAPTGDLVDEVIGLRFEMHRESFDPRADAVSTLRELRARGCKTGLLSNCSSELPELMAASALAGLFDAEIYSAACALRKPERAIYELAAAQLGVEPERCLFVGDGDDHELEGARDAGMRAVLLRSGDTNSPEGWRGPEISSLAQTLELVA
jgi:putative hydrolase of the HAD superfamily